MQATIERLFWMIGSMVNMFWTGWNLWRSRNILFVGGWLFMGVCGGVVSAEENSAENPLRIASGSLIESPLAPLLLLFQLLPFLRDFLP